MKPSMIRLFAVCVLAMLLLPLSAMAQESAEADQTPSDATKKVHEMLDQPKPTEDGAKQAPQGEALPEENWFGCMPDEQKQDQHCGDKRGGSQEINSQESGEAS